MKRGVQVIMMLFGLFGGWVSYAQELVDIPVVVNGTELKNPYVGGLISPQFATMDLDNDRDEDLVVFDRVGNVVRCFENNGGELVYSMVLSSRWPELGNWFRLADIDGDGIKDLFTFSASQVVAGVEVHRCSFDEDNQLEFELISLSESENLPNVLYYPIGNGTSQIFVSSIDLPEIKDIDDDGDIDIVTFDQGGSHLYLYESLNAQEGDLLRYELKNDCFGGILESGISQEIFLASGPQRCATEDGYRAIEKRHAGSTTTLLDINDDGLLDAFIGDISSVSMANLMNGGTPSIAWFDEKSEAFPADNPFEINVFNSMFKIDETEEAIELVMSSNESVGLQTIDHIYHIEFDKSTGSPLLINKNYLVDEQLQFGKNSHPCVLDVDGDGLDDILVGSAGTKDFEAVRNGSLWWLKNYGDRFELMTDDFLGFSRFYSNSVHFAPTAGDLDSDGDMDLLVGDDKGRLYYVENISNGSNLVEFAEPVYNYMNIRPGVNARPSIFDVDGDGLSDIIIGERNFNSEDNVRGSLNLYLNIGSPNEPSFSEIPTTEVFGNIFANQSGFIRNNATPHFFNLAGGEDYLALVGTVDGKLRYYKGGFSTSVFEEVLYEYNVDEGEDCSPVLGDFDGDGVYELVVGNKRGGLAIYDSPFRVNGTVPTKEPSESIKLISIFPNPNSGENLTLSAIHETVNRMMILDLEGKIIEEWSDVQSQQDYRLSTRNLESGIYICVLLDSLGNRLGVERVVITR